MRTLDEETGAEIEGASEKSGFFYEAEFVSPEAYKTIDNVRKFALAPEDYETVLFFHRYTPEELAERELQAAQSAYDEAREEWEELLESLFSADSLADFLKLIIATRSRAVVAKRRKLREALQAAQAKLRP